MPYGDYAECPHCGKTAYGENDIEKEFGFRVMGSKTIPQSWCRDCRSNGNNNSSKDDN
jgi:hypothetical protein